jgi:hypothetical protein
MLIQIYIAAGDGPILQKGLYERGGMIFAVLEPGNDGEVTFDDFLGCIMEDIGRLRMEKWHFCDQRKIYGAN